MSAITLRWLIDQGQLGTLKCVAAHHKLDNVVESVNVIDNPDVGRWMRRNELVITTGYVMREDAALQLEVLRQLKEAGCAGLLFKIKRFFEEVPQNMVEEAERLEFPIIAIPFYLSFADIAQKVVTAIDDNRIARIEREYDVFNRLDACYRSNADLSAMLDIIASATGRIVILTDVNRVPVALGFAAADDARFSRADFQAEDSASFVALSHSEDGSQHYAQIGSLRIPSAIVPLPENSGYLFVELGDGKLDDVLPILSRSLPFVKLQFEKRRSQSLLSSNDFFFNFLYSPESKSEDEIKLLCSLFDFDLTRKRVCLTVKFADAPSHTVAELCGTIKQFMERNEQHCFICSRNKLICVFVYYKPEVKNIFAVTHCTELANRLHAELTEHSGVSCIIGVGRCHKQIGTVGVAFRDSLKTVQFIEELAPSKPVSSYFEQMPYHVLSALSRSELEKICRDSIWQLIEYDRDNKTDLVATLEMYFTCKFNAAEMAKRLFLHRNTLAYRLEKIQEMLNIRLDNAQELFSVYISLCALNLLDYPKGR